MENFLDYYQHLPFYIEPIIKIGFFSVSWYSVMYLVGGTIIYFLLKRMVSLGELNLEKCKTQNAKRKTIVQNLKFNKSLSVAKENEIKNSSNVRELDGTGLKLVPAESDVKKDINNFIVDLLLYLFVGLLIGARLGYVLFYNFSYYWKNPLAIISPFDMNTGELIGIYGLSYHGGVIGIIVAGIVFSFLKQVNFWVLAEFLAPAIPAGYFWGRIGNFINGELYGRVTEKPWGMYFPSAANMPDPDIVDRQNFSSLPLRHPSQLYEAFFEGLVLFIILWIVRNKYPFQGKLIFVYIIGYSVFRFFIEFFREPDPQLGLLWGGLTMGQFLSIFIIVLAGMIYWRKEKNLV